MKLRFVKMTRRFLLGALLSLSALAGVLHAQCDYCLCRYYKDYLPDHNGNNCATSFCEYRCATPQALTAWSPELTGVEVSDDVHPVVVAIYPNSPAERAGIRVGDALIKINGKPLPYSCFLDTADVAQYLIKRGTQEMEVALRRVSPTEAIFRASDSRFRNVGLKGFARLASLPPYISGAILRKTRRGLLVDSVIPSTPAEQAGIEKGSRVLAILDASTNQPSNAGEGADYRANLKFVLASRGTITTKTLTLLGLSEVLSGMAAMHQPAPLTASLGASQ